MPTPGTTSRKFRILLFAVGAAAACATGAAAGQYLRLEEGALLISGPPRLQVSGPGRASLPRM